MSTEILSERYDATVVAHSAATTAKNFYVVGGNACMAMNDADADVENVFVYGASMIRVPKESSVAWSFGDKVYWDATAENFTKTATANTLAGIAAEDAASADTEAVIHLMPASVVNAA
jgi:predicted RecA/RadA family phage recombinase